MLGKPKNTLKKQYEKAAESLGVLSPLTITPPKFEREMRLFGQNGGYAKCQVTFYSGGQKYDINGRTATFLQDDASAGFSLPENNDKNLDSDLIAVHTDKSLEAPAGTFTVTMHDRPMRTGNQKGKRLAEIIMQNDLVCISFGRSDSDGTQNRNAFYAAGSPERSKNVENHFECVMVGIVGARPTVNWTIDGNGATVRQITITGFDFGKLLLNCQIYYFKDVPSEDIKAFALKGWQYLKDGTFPMGTKQALIQKTFDEIFRKITNWTVDAAGGGVPIGDLFGYVLRSTYGEIPVGTNFFSQEQSIWSFIEAIAEKPWCELFVDTVPHVDSFLEAFKDGDGKFLEHASKPIEGGMPMLFLRESPFSSSDWERLPLYYVSDDVVHNFAIGGEPTLYNLFYARPSAYLSMGSVMSAYLTGVPIFDSDSFKKYGLRMLISESKVFPYDGAGTAIKAVGKALTKKLYEWFASSPYFLSGTMTVQGHPSYRIGTRLRRCSLDQSFTGTSFSEFYIEGVSHEWSAYGEYKTTLRLTRGLYIADEAKRFPEPPDPDYDAIVSTVQISTISEGA